jgi:glutaredoxin-related protein
MRIIMYGTAICPDCVEAKQQLSKNPNIELDYRNITESTKTLKEFLAYRDHEAIFRPVIKEGRIGIPFFVLEDGTKTFELPEYVSLMETETAGAISSCSLDGKGQC